jgi:hypothetical protein
VENAVVYCIFCIFICTFTEVIHLTVINVGHEVRTRSIMLFTAYETWNGVRHRINKIQGYSK